MKAILLYGLLSLFFTAHSQKFFNWWDPRDENIDSLKKALLVAQGQERVRCLNNLCYAYSGCK
ncbi:MAG TPA: hypothetical protein VFL47_10160, partial [Flavisolibacter sp.]|nr:hypothetical protein [Flavisolibacter sp.]